MFVHRFTNYKLEIFIYDYKLLWNWFELSSSYILFSKQNFEPKKLIYSNFKQYFDQFKLDIFNSKSALRTHAAFENNFVSILDKQAP